MCEQDQLIFLSTVIASRLNNVSAEFQARNTCARSRNLSSVRGSSKGWLNEAENSSLSLSFSLSLLIVAWRGVAWRGTGR